MLKRAFGLTLAVGLLFASSPGAAGQQDPPQADSTIDAATRTKVIDGALEHLRTAYVFPETAKKMADADLDTEWTELQKHR